MTKYKCMHDNGQVTMFINFCNLRDNHGVGAQSLELLITLKAGDGSMNQRLSTPLRALADTIERRARLLPSLRVMKVVCY
jgi:hypothetical protein